MVGFDTLETNNILHVTFLKHGWLIMGGNPVNPCVGHSDHFLKATPNIF